MEAIKTEMLALAEYFEHGRKLSVGQSAIVMVAMLAFLKERTAGPQNPHDIN